MNEVNYKQMTPAQLKEYLSTHRNDDEKFSLALGELMSRDIWTEVSADTPLAPQEEILKRLVERKKSS